MSLASHRCCARLKILKQAWIFSASPIITPQGLCIHRKAINKNKHPVLWRTAFQAEYRVEDYPGTPPPSVYQVTHGTALQAAERYVRQPSCGWYPTTGMTATCKAKRFIS